MGKIRTRVLGMEDVEKQQKDEQKKRSEEKKMKRKSSKAVEAIKEAEKKEKMEVEEIKTEKKKDTKESKKTVLVRKIRARGKKHVAAAKKVDKNKLYLLEESVPLLKKIKYAKFDEAVELHLNVDKEGIKGEVELPHATGKTVRVAIVDDKLLDKLESGTIDFDILITHPSFMPKLAKFARVLGPKGLMPNPKSGTISTTPEQVAKKFEKGMTRFKSEPKFPLVHLLVGKVSHEDKALVENAKALLQAVGKAHIKDAYIKTTMSPSLKINIENL